MLSLAAKNLWARKLRALGTTLAVFIGVSLVAGTYVLTDTTNAAFDEIFTESLKGTDVVVTAKQPVRQESGETPKFSAKVLDKVERVPGVALASGAIFTPGGIFKGDEEVGSQFAPKFISSVLPPRLESLTWVEGNPPVDPHEASIDKAAADESGLKVGDPVRLAGERRAKTYFLTGLTELGDASFGGASIATVSLPQAQYITGSEGQFDQISVAGSEDVTPTELRARIQQVVPDNVRVETGAQNANRASDEIREDLGFLSTALFVFAAVSLIVGAFVIFNTFSITVAQRIREFGMLRTIGASRRQILTSVVAESLLIGALGAVAGIFGGLAFTKGIEALFDAIGIGLPSTSPVVATRTIVVSLLIGILVTLVASLSPALRSTRVPPMAALRDIELPGRRRRSAIYAGLAVLLGVVGLAMVLIGLFANIEDSGQAALLLGGGAAAVIFGVALISPRLVRPMAAVAGAPLERLRGLVGRLARENAQRKPSRTAATSAAVMIGLGLVIFVTIFAAGIKDSISTAIDRNFQGQLVLQNTDGFSPIPNRAAKAVSRMPGVETVSAMRVSQAKVEGDKDRVTGLDPKQATQVLALDWEEGSNRTLVNLKDSQAIVDKSFADSSGLEVGDRVRVLTQTGKRPSFEIVGEVKDSADLLGSVIVTQKAMAREFGTVDDTFDFVKLAPGANSNAVQNRIKAMLTKAFPTAEVLNNQELKENQEEQINQLLGMIYALLSLAVVVSLFGVANTLALSIHERTRELGMLRAVGMSRRQVRRMIRYEAVITALIGASLGLVLGAVFAALISRPLEEEGFVLSYPVGTLIVIMVLAALAGVLVAIGPARRASKLDVLEALAYE